MNTALVGSLAGLIATVPMSATMLLLRRFAPPETRYAPLPPETVTANAAEDAHVRDDLGAEGLRAATVAGHFAYGAAAGALFAPIAGWTPRPVAAGVGFGLALWAVGYQGWVPAFGLMPPATEQPAGRNAVMIAAHAVWGVTAGLLLGRAAGGRHGNEQ